ncbi:hypothetical protein K1W69_07185 [Hoeflea sp. WL0058]|uniref:Uncharacterized protein n=1 Tax=Flavimaribacter sediminis TaxID=2865987 RepID=A0AAE3D0F3_9HYPH|nr:hypothetical protein [Flavimaribacter sediminis]MBW8636967.1 hypothetical protein [Flavimaribacter sediminis]
MGDFDETIRWLKERRNLYIEDLEDIENGAQYFRNEENITEKRRVRLEQSIKDFDVKIAAYEAHNEE